MHGERNQRPKALARLNGKVRGALSADYSARKYKQNADESEYQRIGKPSFRPPGKGEAEAGEVSFGDGICMGLRHLKWVYHTSYAIPGIRDVIFDFPTPNTNDAEAIRHSVLAITNAIR